MQKNNGKTQKQISKIQKTQKQNKREKKGEKGKDKKGKTWGKKLDLSICIFVAFFLLFRFAFFDLYPDI